MHTMDVHNVRDTLLKIPSFQCPLLTDKSINLTLSYNPQS